MSARGEVGVEIVDSSPPYVSARTPVWLMEAAGRRGWERELIAACELADERLRKSVATSALGKFGERDADELRRSAERWVAVANALCKAVAGDARDSEVV